MTLGITLVVLGIIDFIIGATVVGITSVTGAIAVLLAGSGLIVLTRRLAKLERKLGAIEREAELAEKIEDRQLRKAVLTRIDRKE